MILAAKLLGLADTNFLKTFEIVIQLGAIAAVAVLYFNKYWKSITGNWDLIKKLLVAFIPTGIVGIILYPIIKGVLLGSSSITLTSLFVGGLALIAVEMFLKGKKTKINATSEISYRNALIIGTFQSLSVIPGVSRAAATIVGGLLTGLNRETATEFSFLLAVPTMIAATALDIFKSRHDIVNENFLMILIGTVVAFVVAMVTVKFLINFVKKHDFKIFGVYRIVLSILFWMFVK